MGRRATSFCTLAGAAVELEQDVSGHCHGHQTSAAAVSVVSRQFDSVRVEQNHCQGLHAVNASWEKDQPK